MKTKNFINRYCVRKNCHERVYFHNLEAIEKRLCVAHYEIWLKNKQKRTCKKKKCAFCHKVLENTRNKKYCSVQCRQANLKLIDDDTVLSITKTAEWQRVERLLRKSPLGLASINNLEDIFNLYIYKYYERNYEHEKNNKLLAKLKLNHIQSIKHNGKYAPNNLIITPFSIKSTEPLVPFIYAKINYSDKPYFIKKSLLSALIIAKCPKEDIINLCSKIKKEVDLIKKHKRSSYMTYDLDSGIGNKYRNPFLFDVEEYYQKGEFRILYCCLLEQLERFDSSSLYKSFRQHLYVLFNKESNLEPLLNIQLFELTAIAVFHAFLNYNKGHIIGLINNLKLNDKNSIPILFYKIVEYINHNFAQSLTPEIENISQFIKFYNRFFTGDISAILNMYMKNKVDVNDGTTG